MSASRVDALAGWTAVVLVLAAVFMAWMDSAAEHFVHAAALAAGAAWLLYKGVRAEPPFFHPLAVIPAACAAWAVVQISFAWTISSYDTWNAAASWLARAVVLTLACAGFRTRERREKLITCLVWFGGAYALLGLLSWYAGAGRVLWLFPTGYSGDVAATFTNRDQYAAFIELLLPFALWRVLASPGSQWPPAACAGAMFASVLASGSRAGALIVSAEVLLIVVAVCFSRRANRRAAALLAASLLICTLIGGAEYVLGRFTQADPFAYRREMLAATVDMIRARPLTGFGLGAWPAVYPGFAVFDPPGVYMNHAHNDWAEAAADGGLLFVMTLAGFAAGAAILARRHLWALGMPAVFLHACVDFPLQKAALACALMFVAGLAAAGFEHRERLRPARASGPLGSRAPARLTIHRMMRCLFSELRRHSRAEVEERRSSAPPRTSGLPLRQS
jgi:O-antigen ligase